MIRNVLFDLDDTLFDFHKAEKIALTKTLVHFGIDPTEETLALYSTINAAHWKRLELGEISREEVKVGRYRELFKTIGVECDPVKATAYYESMLAIGHYFMPGAPELLGELYGKYRLYIVSNGTAKVQEGRIGSSGIANIWTAYLSLRFSAPISRTSSSLISVLRKYPIFRSARRS